MAITLGDAILTLGADVNPLNKAINQASNNVKSGLGNAANAGKLLFAGMAASIAASITGIAVTAFKTANDFDAASKKMTSALGLPIEEANRLKDLIKDVYGNNFGESIAQVGDVATRVMQSLKDIGVTSNESIKQVTEGVIALADTFDSDYEKSIGATKALMESFGLTGEQALDFITSGMQKGLNASDDFLDSITEYSNQFAVGGADAGQFFSVMETGLASGVLGTDKAADMFKEFQVRILDGSKTTSEALQQIGIDSDTFLAAVSSGQMSVAKAFQNVQSTLGGVTDQATLMQAGVGLMGTQFEDLGYSVALGVDMSKTKLSELAGATDLLNNQYSTLGGALSGIWRKVQIAFEPAGAAMLNALQVRMPQIQALIDSLLLNAPRIGELFGNVLDALTNTIIPILGKIMEFVGSYPLISTFILAFAAITPIILALVPVFTLLGTVFSGLGMALTAITGGITLFGLATAGIVAGVLILAGAVAGVIYQFMLYAGGQKELEASNEALEKSTDKYINKLKAQGVALDEAKMKAMEHSEKMVYMEEQKNKAFNESTRNYISMLTGVAATEEQFATAKNLMLNEEIDQREAVYLTVMDLSESQYQELMKADKETVASTLGSLGLQGDAWRGYLDTVTLDSTTTQQNVANQAKSSAQIVSDEHAKASQRVIDESKNSAVEYESYWTEVIANISALWDGAVSMFKASWQWIKDSFNWITGNSNAQQSNAPGFAKGVNNFGGGMALVGERGPELVNLPKGSDVITASRTREMLSSNLVNNSIAINVSLTGSNHSPDQIAKAISKEFSRTMSRQGAF